MKQQTWFTLHHWAGFHLSLLLSFILLTGTFATVSTDIDWLTNSAVRAEQMISPQAALDWPALLVSAQSRYPNLQISSIERPKRPWHNVEVVVLDTNNQRFRLYLDGITHEIKGQAGWFNWQQFFRQIHRTFMLPIKVGVTLVGVFALLLLFLLVTALYAYRHWWKYFFSFERIKRVPNSVWKEKPRKLAAHKRRFWSELHKLVGLWSIWFIVVISVTGLWYLIEQWGGAANYPKVENQLTSTVQQAQDMRKNSVSISSLSFALQQVTDKYPQFIINKVRFIGAKDLIEIEGQERAWLVRDRANQQVFDAHSGRFLTGRQAESLNWHFRISEAADPLHFGSFYSWIISYVWFVFGLALTSLSLTGVYLYLLRLKQSGALRIEGALHSVKRIWIESHWLKWPSIILLGICSSLVLQQILCA